MNADAEQRMQALLPAAAALALPAISDFRVGAVAQGESGALYLGANLEFAGLPLSFSVHAEQAAISSAWLSGETGVRALAVTAAPCGLCRQFLAELGDLERLRIFVAGSPPQTLATLLPQAFGPGDLGIDDALFRPRRNGLALAPAATLDALTRAALAAADRSYAPYSRTPAGVALETEDGAIYAGRYAESAAFNPSLSPVAAALSQLALSGTSFARIVRAVLAEAEGPISQREAAKALLGAAAPGIPLSYARAAATPEAFRGLDSTDTSAQS